MTNIQRIPSDSIMRVLAGWVVAAACDGGGAGPDGSTADARASVDAPPDPFAGRFDDPSEFPRDNCTPGSVAGFDHAEMWPTLALRTKVAGDALETYLPELHDEVLVPHLRTPDDLLVRHSYFTGRWWLRAIDVCGVAPDGTLRGAVAVCAEYPPPTEPCSVLPFVAAPFRWLPGEAVGEHLTLVGEYGAAWPGASTEVRVDGDVAYLSRFDDGLRVVSIANPAAPTELAHVALAPDWANDLELLRGNDGRRYVITASVTANIFDVTNPASPELVAQLPFAPHSVFVDGTTAYLVDGGSRAVDIWDLSQPRAPVRLAAWSHPEPHAWHDIFVADGIAYLSDIYGGGLHVVDVTNPSAPVVIGGEQIMDRRMWHTPWLTTIGGQPVAVSGTEGDASIGFRLLAADLAAPDFLATLGEWTLAPGTSAHNLMAIGPRIYLAHYRHGVRVVDASNPAAPVQLAYFNTWPIGVGGAADLGTYGIDLDPARRRIYLADSVRGLVILEGDATVFP